MKKLVLLLILCPWLLLGSERPKLPSKITDVTVYLNGAQVTRTAMCHVKEGSSTIVLGGLSTKIDENSIQVSGLQSVSILSMEYDINYLKIQENSGETGPLEHEVKDLEQQIALLKNTISGLEEEEQVIYANRTVGTRLQNLSLENIKEISTYYRERITAIKNAIFKANTNINVHNERIRSLKQQLAELNNAPETEQGEITLKLDAPVATGLNLILSYQVADAGWIPNYDIKSEGLKKPLKLAYKAHVYQKTGAHWNDVNITLSTGNPTINVAKPHLGTKYLNFTNGYAPRPKYPTQKHRYVYNPTVKKITGVVTDGSGLALPGVSIVIKGTSKGTQTDFDGYYSINTQGGSELVFSYLGHHNQEIPMYSSVMNVRMEEDAQALDEVVVVGYGTSNKKNYSNTVSSVTSEDINRTLAGSTPGVQIRGTATQKYATPNIKRQPPLYVIDGVPVSDFMEGDLDESEIQSVEVLKGTSSSSLYGARGSNGVILITTKKSTVSDEVTHTKFTLKKSYTIISDADITSLEINTFQLKADYEYLAAPLVNENVFLTSSFRDWEALNLLPGEASIYFKGGYAGKTTIDPYTTNKEMVVSLGIEPSISVTRKQDKNFKSKNFTGSNRVLDRTYHLEVKNNKTVEVDLKLMDRIPISQNKEIKVDDIVTKDAEYDSKKGVLTWKMTLAPKETRSKSFSFQVKYPKHKTISL